MSGKIETQSYLDRLHENYQLILKTSLYKKHETESHNIAEFAQLLDNISATGVVDTGIRLAMKHLLNVDLEASLDILRANPENLYLGLCLDGSGLVDLLGLNKVVTISYSGGRHIVTPYRSGAQNEKPRARSGSQPSGAPHRVKHARGEPKHRGQAPYHGGHGSNPGTRRPPREHRRPSDRELHDQLGVRVTDLSEVTDDDFDLRIARFSKNTNQSDGGALQHYQSDGSASQHDGGASQTHQVTDVNRMLLQRLKEYEIAEKNIVAEKPTNVKKSLESGETLVTEINTLSIESLPDVKPGDDLSTKKNDSNT